MQLLNTHNMKCLFTFVLSFLLLNNTSIAQNNTTAKKELPAVRTHQKIKIDGVINDDAWKTAAKTSGLVEWRPSFGKAEDEQTKTELYFLYDNSAIYVAGFCHEVSADSISKELVGRDVVGVNDFVGVLFDTYDDKINGFGYYVTPLGEQFDAKYSSNGEDGSWNSVFESAAKIVKGGWTFEMKIPYGAIRFSNKPIQNWGLNITRKRSKSGKQFMWNPVNPVVGGTLFAQSGKWTNIENIKPPIRLSFSPYLSTYVNHYPYNSPNQKNWNASINGGMDVKYGINQAFTLDMTLIPDFGQVQSDNQVLNLSPFEVRYNENRSFFTEGTELFGKGNLFYSRRIGGTPLHYYDVYNQLSSNETVKQNPSEAKLLNATKISGRTSKGLGIGFFNAVEDEQFATIEDNSKTERSIQTNPLTNYNIVVLDQTLKNNSSISFINTNTMRSGSDYDANVAAAMWDVYDKKNNWNVWGKLGVSQLFGYEAPQKTKTGYTQNLGIGKFGGRFNFSFNQEIANHKYDQNDMGYFTNNNYIDNNLWAGYKWLKPKKWYNNLYLNVSAYYSFRYLQGDYQTLVINSNINGQLKNLWNVGIKAFYNAEQNDFYEPRINGMVFKRPQFGGAGFWIYTNSAKKYSAGIDFTARAAKGNNTHNFEMNLSNQYRFNKKLTLSISNYLMPMYNNLGFATTDNGKSIFALRNRITVENVFNVKYNFNNKMGLSLRARHYWSKVENNQFFNLQQDGSLATTTLTKDVNQNANFFNIDMVYNWQFALGSFVNIVWKNAIGSFDNNIQDSYFSNFKNTLSAPQNNSVSIRVIYFLDYLNLKKKK